MTTLWRLPCLDIAGRPRCLTVRAGTDVTLGWPAAEFASVTAGDARALVGLLTLAERVVRARSASTSSAATSFRSTGRGVSSNTAALAAASTGAAAPSTGSPLRLPVEAETRRTRPAPNAVDAPPGLIRPGSDAVPAGAAASTHQRLAAAPSATVGAVAPDTASTVHHTRTWAIPCADATGRQRTLVVRAIHHGVTLRMPPGESAAMSPSHARILAAILDGAS